MARAGKELALAAAGGLGILLGAGERMLGLLALGDIERDADDVHHLAGLAQRRLGSEEHAGLALAVGDDLLDVLLHPAGGEDARVQLAVAMGVILAEQIGDRPADGALRIDAEEVALLLVDEDAAPFGIGRTDHGRNRVDDMAQPLAALLHLLDAEPVGEDELLFQSEGALADDLLLAA